MLARSRVKTEPSAREPKGVETVEPAAILKFCEGLQSLQAGCTAFIFFQKKGMWTVDGALRYSLHTVVMVKYFRSSSTMPPPTPTISSTRSRGPRQRPTGGSGPASRRSVAVAVAAAAAAVELNAISEAGVDQGFPDLDPPTRTGRDSGRRSGDRGGSSEGLRGRVGTPRARARGVAAYGVEEALQETFFF